MFKQLFAKYLFLLIYNDQIQNLQKNQFIHSQYYTKFPPIKKMFLKVCKNVYIKIIIHITLLCNKAVLF